jgi:hypothetical protein
MAKMPLLLFLGLLLFAASLGAEVTVHTIHEKGIAGTLVSIEKDGKLTLRSKDGKERTLACAEVIRIVLSQGLGKGAEEDTELVFHNGDRMYGEIGEADPKSQGQEIPFRGRSFDRVVVELGAIRWVKFPRGRTKLLAVPPGESGRDYVFKTNGDRISGTVDSLYADRVGIDRSGTVTRIPTDEVLGIYASPLEEFPAPEDLYAVIRLRSGDRLAVRIDGFREGVFRVRHGFAKVFAMQGESRTEKPLEIAEEEVLSVSFRNGLFVYVSDLEPAAIEQVKYCWDEPKIFKPPFGRQRILNFRRDRSYGGNPLTLAGKQYAKGIGSHTWCKITYALEGKYQKFEAVIGVDDEVLRLSERGSVIFRVEADGKEIYRSPVLTGGGKPQHISVPLAGVKTLALVADYSGDVFDGKDDCVCDRADWADAILAKK